MTCKKEIPVAVIIINWNSYIDTFECLKSLEKQSYANFHVYLIDNDSTDGSYEKLKKDSQDNHFKLEITFIQAGSNLGFAGANNLGIKEAYNNGIEYFWLLNNDTVVDKDALLNLVNLLNSNKKIGIVGSKIYYFETNIIWFAGGLINKFTGKTHHIGIGEQDKGQFNVNKEIDYVTGCSLAFRKELIDTIGYLKEDYFLYYEETDWNLKASKNGWKILYCPESIVYHKVSSSSGGQGTSPFVQYYKLRNRFIMMNRLNRYLYLTNLLFLIINLIKMSMKIFLMNKNKQMERIWYLHKGFFDALRCKMGKHPDYFKSQNL
ncbi:glycosyltransferase family 2 protein [Neobacillus niacini]|uniref:glycosyltransferase family 2 protein n=1 Tax=Neobacillus niacini TaxID=86668 RepID=UPI0007AB2B2A|nr:glycosyltransferase family 2 protein [Neobacillus niacini]MEC1526012.1 glycosyltransferase family 2 protein [Neobacillus niacini]